MIKTNKQVIQDFVNGRSSKNMNLTSIDGSLYSYNFKIAENSVDLFGKNGIKTVFDYSIHKIEELTGVYSMTTRQHLGILKREIKKSDFLNWTIKE